MTFTRMVTIIAGVGNTLQLMRKSDNHRVPNIYWTKGLSYSKFI
jgi:hypothetical protein